MPILFAALIIVLCSGNTTSKDYKYRLIINNIEYKIYDIIVIKDRERDKMEIRAITKLPGFERTLPVAPKDQYAVCKDFPIWCVCSNGEAQYHGLEMEFQPTKTPGEIAVVYHFSYLTRITWIAFFETEKTSNQIVVDWK